MTPSSAADSGQLLDQLYVTHCLHDEGVHRRAGFNVRASSTPDPLLLRFALEYPPYEPPLGMRGEGSGAADLPRRLALVRIPGGTALIHSAHLPDDGRGRANNFFSHLLSRPGLAAREALTTWASPDWVEGCDPQTGTDLPPLDGLPRPGPINDEAVTAFLQQAKVSAEGGLGSLLCPERLANSPARRRDLVAQVLRGCLHVLRAGPAAPRGRLYVLGEPGLVALLLYAAARLLPDRLAAGLTFSTYENAHRDLRLFRHAAVIGTWTADPARGLAEEFFTARGYGLNTVSYKASPELDADGDAPVGEWVDLAANGDWATVDRARRMLGKMTSAVVSYSEGLAAARLLRRVKEGEVGADDLLTLKRSAWGPPILRLHDARIWPRVRDGSLTDARLRAAFADMLRERLDELQAAAARALRDGGEDWQPHWQRITELLGKEPARLREAFRKLLPAPPYAPPLRLALLREFHGLPTSSANDRAAPSALLRGCAADDLDLLAGSGLPSAYLARALCYALLEPATQAEAARRLRAADDDLLRAFWEQFRFVKEEERRRALLTPLFPPADPCGRLLLGRALRARVVFPAETLAWLLESLGAWGPDWDAFWGSDGHRGFLLDLLRQLDEPAGPLWQRLGARLDRALLLPGASSSKGLLLDLVAAVSQPGPAVPPAFAAVVRDWALLHDHFEKAAALPDEGARRAVIDACNRRGLGPFPLLAGYFERFVRPQGMNAAVLEDFAGFFHTFCPAGADYQDHASRVAGWLGVVGGCPEEERARYQRYYLERFVPLEFRWRLAEEGRQSGRLLPAAYEGVVKPTRPGAPAAAVADAAHEDDLFPVLGVRAAESVPLPWAVWKRFPWLLCGAAAGVVAVLAASPPAGARAQKMTGLVALLPLVLTLAEAMAVQASVLTARLLREPGGARPLSAVGRELLAGLVGAAACGLVAGAAAAWCVPVWQAIYLAGGAAAAVTAACGLAVVVPALLARLGLLSRLPVGLIARAAAGAVAVVLYLALAHLLG